MKRLRHFMHVMYFCVSYDSKNEQLLFTYIALTD
jgi:hypothetical protein